MDQITLKEDEILLLAAIVEEVAERVSNTDQSHVFDVRFQLNFPEQITLANLQKKLWKTRKLYS
jgi:hypothetical protein